MNIKLKVEECPETGDLVLVFPDELCEELGWKVGDDLIWEESIIDEDEGSYKGFSVRKK